MLADVDSRAIDLAAQNVALNGLVGRVEARLSDGLRHLGGAAFDTIVSHFPLHLQREEQTRLIREARGALTDGGQLYVCGLAAYDLRPALRAAFGHARTVVEGRTRSGDRYRIVAASKSGGEAKPVLAVPGQQTAGMKGMRLDGADAYTCGVRAARVGRSSHQAPPLPAVPTGPPAGAWREPARRAEPTPSSSSP